MQQNENLLSAINIAKNLSDLLEKAKRSLPYNINIIDELHANENAHSRILCKLLQYQDIEGRYRILESFIHYVSLSVPSFGEIRIKHPKITQEEKRIDLWVRDSDYAIIIENKVYGAVDQYRQLERYIDETKNNNYKEKNIFIVYLPYDNHEPGAYSWGRYKKLFEDRYAIVSFQYDIVYWLKNQILPQCTIKEELLVSAIRQYIDYLEGLFNLRESQKKMYHMDNEWLHEIGIEGKSFPEQLKEINEYIKKLEQGKIMLQNYRNEHTKIVIDAFSSISQIILGETWKQKDSISNEHRWYYLYDDKWGTGGCVHLEWSGVSIEDLFILPEDHKYRLVLHVEGTYTNNQAFTNLLKKNLGDLYISNGNKTTFWSGYVDAPIPIGNMDQGMLKEYLDTKVYNSIEIRNVIDAVEKTSIEYAELRKH